MDRQHFLKKNIFLFLLVVLFSLISMPCTSLAVSYMDDRPQLFCLESPNGQLYSQDYFNYTKFLSDRHNPIFFTHSGRGHLAESGIATNTAPTPIPGAAWLLGTGLAGFWGIRRRMGKEKEA